MSHPLAAAGSLLAMDERGSLARSIYLVVTVAVAVIAWLLLCALLSPFAQLANPDAAVNVANPRQGQFLPLRYVEQIVHVQGARNVTWMNYWPLLCTPTIAATLNAYAGPGTHHQLAVAGNISTAMERAWNASPMNILVGSTLASECGWHIGTTVSPPGMNGRPVQVHVAGVYHSKHAWANLIALAHYGYVNRILPTARRDQVQSIMATADNTGGDPALAARINALFAHSDPPVSATFNTTSENIFQRFGDVRALLVFVMAAALACTTLVLVSVWAHAAAQRRRRSAVLQSFGFSRRLLFASFALECLVILLVGAGIGIGLGLLATHAVAPLITPILGTFAPPRFAWLLLPAWLVPLLVVSMVIPAVVMARTRPRDYARA